MRLRAGAGHGASDCPTEGSVGHPLRLDVTKPEDIAAAVETVNKAGRGLYALVNNAGVAITGPPVTSEEDFDFLFDVNVYGPYRVTRAFSPLIVQSKGRIAIISSISGILSARNLGVYSMSKHAIEASRVVPNQHVAEITIQKAIEELVQLTEGHAYSYDRASLVAMLDAALAKSRIAQ
jgi:NAD(P)-dependent dehydrogenase (short-subunit alcohol dehydrogenase family)